LDLKDEIEVAAFVIRSEEPWHEGELDYDHYRALQLHLFRDGEPNALFRLSLRRDKHFVASGSLTPLQH
jgi:hypothetical protein